MKTLTKKIKLLSILAIIAMIVTPLSMAVGIDPTNKNLAQSNSIIDQTNGAKGTSQPVAQDVPKIVPQIAPQVASIIDDFNRPDGPIGPKWTNDAGSFVVFYNAAMGSGSTNLATYNGVYSNAVEADVESVGTGVEYVGLVLGYHDIDNNLFLKVQNSDGVLGFDTGACYVGNNGANFGLGFFKLAYPFESAHMRAESIGNTVYITFTHIDGTSSSQSYTCSGAPNTGGSAVGINSYTTLSRIDNFAVGEGAVPADKLYVFARGGDDALWYRTSDGSSWTPWISLGGIITAEPESSKFNGNTYVFVRGSDGALWYRKFDGATWSAWATLGGYLNGGVGSS